MLVLAVRDHIDLYQSGSQTCSYTEVGILWRISVLPMAAYVKQNPRPEKRNQSGAMHHIDIFFSVLFCLFVLCLAASSPDLPCHLLSMALHPSSAVSILPFHLLSSLHAAAARPAPAMLYSSVQDALATLHTQRVEGGLRAQWLFLVDISFFFPWVCSKVFVFWHSRLPCSPFPTWSTSWQQILGSLASCWRWLCYSWGQRLLLLKVAFGNFRKGSRVVSHMAQLSTRPGHPPTSRKYSAAPSALWSSLRTTGLIQWSPFAVRQHSCGAGWLSACIGYGTNLQQHSGLCCVQLRFHWRWW